MVCIDDHCARTHDPQDVPIEHRRLWDSFDGVSKHRTMDCRCGTEIIHPKWRLLLFPLGWQTSTICHASGTRWNRPPHSPSSGTSETPTCTGIQCIYTVQRRGSRHFPEPCTDNYLLRRRMDRIGGTKFQER